MGNVIWNNKDVLKFESTDKELIIASCSSMNIKYILDAEDIVIFPTLHERTIILKLLSNHAELQEAIETIENSLISEGATVIIDQGDTKMHSLRYLDAQFLLSFSNSESTTDLTVYLPFGNHETSLSIAKKLLKHITLLERNITYKVATLWDKISATRYWNYLYGNPTPTIVIELGVPSISAKFSSSFGTSLLKSLVEELGYKPNEEELKSSFEFFHKVNEKLSTVKALDKQHQLNELTAKVKLQENELDELKRSYMEREEALKKITEKQCTEKDEESNQEKPEINQEDILLEETLIHEEQKPTKKKKSTTNKNRNTHRNNGRKSNKLYMPVSKKEQSRVYQYSHLPYPVRIPEGGPVYEFKRPSRETQSSGLPPHFTPKKHVGNVKL